MRNLYANGCSYIRDFHIEHDLQQPSYVDILAQRHGLTPYNNGLPGSCNRRVIRTALRDSLAFDHNWVVLIQLTFLSRTEKAYRPAQDKQWKVQGIFDNEETHESIKVPGNDDIERSYLRNWLEHYDELCEVTNLAADLLMLTAHFRERGIRYFIYAHQPLVNSHTAEAFRDTRLYHALQSDPGVMDILSESLTGHLVGTNKYYDFPDDAVGHLSPHGHELAADVLDRLAVSRLCAPR